MKSEITLRTRLVTLVVAAIVPLFGLSLIGAVLTATDAVTQTTRNLEFSASLVAANQQRVADSVRQVLVAISHVPEMVEGREPACQRYFKSLTAELMVYANVGVIGTDGYVRCHSVPNNPQAFAGDRPYFQAAMKSRNFVAGGFLLGRISGKPIMTFALPVKNADGDVTAVAFAAMYLSEIARAISASSVPAGGRVIVMDRDGVVLAVNPEGSAAVGKPVDSEMIRTAIPVGVPGVLEGQDPSGARQIYALSPSSLSPDAPFFVAVSADRSEVLAPSRRRLALNFLALTLVAFFGSWIAWLLGGRAIVKPAAEILEATGRIQQGRLDVRIPIHPDVPGNELTRIATSFNRMADSLAQRERDLANELASSRQAHASLERMQVEQAKSYAELRQTQSRLLAAQKLGRIGHWELDMRQNRLVWSDELHDLFGLKPGEFDGDHNTFIKMVHPDDRERYEAMRAEALRNGTQLEIEYRIITPAGEVRWMHQRGQVLVNEAGRTVSRSGVVQDITSRKQSELALAHSTTLLQRTGEMARIGGWEVALGSLEAQWSDELVAIYGLEPGQKLDPLQALDFYEPDAQPLMHKAVHDAIRHGVAWDLELPFITARGERIWVRSQGQPIRDNGWTTGLAGALQDITAQYHSREHMRLLETAVSRLNDIVLITEAEPVDEPGPRIVFVNDAFERHTGYSREEVLGRSPRFLQGPNTQRSELDRIAQALKAWQPVRAQLINYTKAGEEFWVELDIVPIADEKGWFTHWVAVQRDITKRMQAEKALMDSEQRYAALFEMAPVAMWVYDATTHHFLTVNRAAVENYGYSAAEFMGMTIFDIRRDSDHAALRNQLLELTTPRPSWQHRRKDGSLLQVNVVSKPIQYGGRKARFVVALDITAQVKAEKDVQDYLFTLQRAADAAQAITWHQTLDGMLQEVAEQARGVIGAHQSIVSLTLDNDWSQAINALSLSEKYAAYRDLREPPDGSGIYAMVCENNRVARMTQAELEAHPRWHSFGSYADKHPGMRGWLAVPLTGRQGQNIGLLQLSDKYEGDFTLQDEYVAIELAQLASIAIENARLLDQVNQLNTGLEQKVVERTLALARQEALFRALAEQAPQVIWTVDTNGEATYFNRAWFDLVGGKLEDWTGRKWSSVIHAEDLPEMLLNWDRAVVTQSPYVGIRRLRARDGSYHVMSYRASPVFGEEGQVMFWIGIDADITEIKSIEAALRLSNQELEAFSYSVSHDLRAPLNTIDGFSRLLAKQLNADVDKKGHHYLSRIQAGVAQMGKLIEDLLSLAQVARMQLRIDTVDLSALSRRILDDWQTREPERKVEFHIEPGLLAQGDARLVRVLMENLLGNAWKFTSQREKANITVGQTPDAAGLPVFFVRDDGAGFDMAYADKLFVAFQRLHAASEFPGTGVGLATVSRVVGRHGGKLWAEGLPGHGATFFFTLPPLSASA
ncbi:MAG: PAS domain S-box protein [Pseudomonadota bacterium]